MSKKFLLMSFVFVMVLLPLTICAAEDQTTKQQIEVLTLEQCLDLGFKNSQQLKASAKKVEIAQQKVREAEGGFWPSATYQVAAEKDEKANQQLGGATEGSSASVTVSQKLYTGGVLTANLRINQLGLSSSQEDERKAKQQLKYDIISAYYKVWQADQVLRAAQNTLETLGRHYQQEKNFFQVGTASKFELLRAQVDWEQQKPQVITAQNNLESAKLQLATKIGFPKERQFNVVYDLSQLKLPNQITITQQDILEKAYQQRSDMRQLNFKKEIDKMQTKLAFAGFKPNLILSGTYTDSAPGSLTLADGSAYWKLNLVLQGTLFDGFTTPAKVSENKKNEELEAINEINLKDSIRLEVEQAIQNLKLGLESTRANQANIDLMKENIRLTQAKFDAGMATTVDIMDAQKNLDLALNGYYQGVSSYLTALANLDLVIGKDN